MKTYLARVRDGFEGAGQIVGIFNARSDDRLFWMLDEWGNPHSVEVTELPEGGIYWDALNTPIVPAPVDENHGAEWQPVPGGGSVCEKWEDAFFDYGPDIPGPSWRVAEATLYADEAAATGDGLK